MMHVRKGQYTLVEQVILFALGISITLGFLFAFKDLRTTVKGDVGERQTELVAEYLASTSLEIVESGAEGQMLVPVPQEIAGDTYAAEMGDGGVLIEMVGRSEVAPLYGLASRVDAGGRTVSSTGEVSVTFLDDDLSIRRAD